MFRIAGFILISCCLFSCKLVDMNEKKSIKKLTSGSIEQYVFKNDTLTVNGYYGGAIGKPVVVFIHGFGGDAQLSWNGMMRELQEDYFVVAIDLLWFGKSSTSGPGNLYSQLDALQLYLEQPLKIAGKNSYTILGHSYGGFVAQGTYFKYPEQVDKMIIIDSPGPTYNTNLLDTLARDAGIDDFVDLFVLKEPKNLVRLNSMAFEDPPKVPVIVRKAIWKKYFASHHPRLRSLLTTLPDTQQEMFGKKPEKEVPTLIVWGEKDKVFPLSEGRKIQTYFDADLFVMDGVGHSAPFEDYGTFMMRFKSFLKE